MTDLPQTFLDLMKTSSTELLNGMLCSLQSEIERRRPDHSTFVSYVPDFCTDDVLLPAILTECEDMGLGTGRKVTTQFLSTTSDPYIYPDTDPIHKAKDFKDYPNIRKLMERVNCSSLVDGPLNSCLVSKYSCPSSSLTLHSDNEPAIDQSKSICSFTLGASRTIEFFGKTSKPKKVTEHRLSEGGLLLMNPGCQGHFKHCIRAENLSSSQNTQSGDQIRYSLSFRAHAMPKVVSNTITPDCNSIRSSPTNVPPQRITLIAGDSYATKLDTDRLGKGKVKVINIAKGGQKITQTENSIVTFINENPNVLIEKFLISVGTNDIRHCREGISHLKGPLKQLCKTIKDLAPSSKVFFQSLLPLPLLRNAMAKTIVHNILTFNQMLVCI